MILLLRILPFCVALFEACVFIVQQQYPSAYPWIVSTGFVVLVIATMLLGWKRVHFFDLLEKMLPTYVLFASLAFGLLLVEGPVAIWITIGLAALSSFLSLELLFLLAYHPSAYPVNGLSRLNIAYVPLSVWYAVFTSSGLMIFLHSSRVWHLLITVLLGGVLFRTTGHPGATHRQNAVWTVIGCLVGLEIGLAGWMLPLSMQMQGIVAAGLFVGMLRVRRYLYEPRPSRRTAWSESIAFVVLFVASLLTAKWV